METSIQRRGVSQFQRIPRAVQLAVVFMCILAIWAADYVHALVIYAPEQCGSFHIATQASALFGPSPHDGSLLHKAMFAPYPQDKGKYVSMDDQDKKRRAMVPPPQDDTSSTTTNQLPNAGIDSATTATTPTVEDGSGNAGALETPKQPTETALFDGCHRLSVSQDIARAKGSIVVLVRGNCEFGKKVYNMQQAGALGVVVVNFKSEGERLANMKLNESSSIGTIIIPSLMVSWNEWELISKCREDNVTLSFTADGEAAFDMDYGRDALNWAMMRGMGLWILFQCGVNMVRLKRRHSEMTARVDAIEALPVCTYSRARREAASMSATGAVRSGQQVSNRHADSGGRHTASSSHVHDGGESSDDNEDETIRLTGQGLNADTSVTMVGTTQGSSEEDDEPICAICLDGFQDGDLVRQLECNHLYHKTCIDPWLHQSSACPTCKRDISNLPPAPSNAYGSLNV
eukprot:CAMPEP_0184699488 /NCGR_PEP_ID=MMETSP0313-20130426/5744_1 /TAXON_ID=2792 /ORGANISM="Porphyridium aerugineum, Strain SAG 1380-2" /LENGTH=459 /DNA_ID=CAMNT_0027158591 /DNA_START=313 /DNA_END=1692 /DNA_ORIENTATION=-